MKLYLSVSSRFHRSARCGVAALAMMLGLGSGASAATYMRVLHLQGMQEVPANASPAIGGGWAFIDTDANTLRYYISFSGLTAAESAAHFHGPAPPGVNAGVMHALPAGNPKVGVWNYNEPQEAEILNGRVYCNIHTGAFPGGEIRGQLVSQVAYIDQAQEVPPTGSPAQGFGLFVADEASNTLTYYIGFTGLVGVETAAHIHGFALHGTNAGVLHALPAGNPKVGTWNYTDAQEEQILSGLTYVNIHTNAFPGGEIRGQVVPLVAPMDAAQEVPPNPTTGAGVGLISYDVVTDNLSYDIRYTNLSAAETAAHIHGWAPVGANAGVLHALPAGPRKLGVWTYGAGNEANLFDNQAYINVHSSAFPGGEIRGQIMGRWIPFASSVDEPSSSLVPRQARVTPNPFSTTTSIGFALSASAEVRVSIHDAQGRLVRSLVHGPMAAGAHEVRWDGLDDQGREAGNGIYRYLVVSSEGQQSGPLTLIR